MLDIIQTNYFLYCLFQVAIFTCTNGYDVKCPHSSQWNFTSRSYECADQKMYICLFDAIKSYASKAVFTEICGSEDLSREGKIQNSAMIKTIFYISQPWSKMCDKILTIIRCNRILRKTNIINRCINLFQND